MIDSLKGDLLEKGEGHAVVDCNGVGYLLHISSGTLAALPSKGPVRLLVHYSVSVDVRSGQSEHKLFGFTSADERHFFRQLIEVQGVSANIGMAIMGAQPVERLRSAVLNGDEGALRSVKGIGPKLAQRVVAELRSKLLKEPITVPLAHSGGGNSLRTEALQALVSLGLDRAKAERSLTHVLEENKGDTPELADVIRRALKNQ
ncbi:MAG: Holliday junction branch migration protein RuvA [Flavobacteriales bacterium]